MKMGGILRGMVISPLVSENGWDNFFLVLSSGIIAFAEICFFLYRFVKYTIISWNAALSEVSVIEVGFLNDCFWKAEMHNKINNVSMGRNTRYSFVTLGIFEKLESFTVSGGLEDMHQTVLSNGGQVWWQRGTVLSEAFQQFLKRKKKKSLLVLMKQSLLSLNNFWSSWWNLGTSDLKT